MPGVALLMDMGTGKTLTTIGIAGRLHLDHGLSRVAVLCPASVIGVWGDQLAEHADYPYTVSLAVGTLYKRSQALKNLPADTTTCNFVVLNYEAIGRNPQIENLLAKWQPQLVVADEMHRIKTPGAKQSRATRRLGDKATWRIGLTGTPIGQSPASVYGQWSFLDRSIFGQSHTAFRARYMIEHAIDPTNRWSPKISLGPNPDTLPELVDKAHSIAYTISKEECLDLPDTVDTTRTFDLGREGRRAYKQLLRDSITSLASEEVVVASNVLTKALRLQQVAGGFVTTTTGRSEHVHNDKLNTLLEVVEEALAKPSRKVVIFAKFTAEIDAIHEAVRIAGHTACVLDGRTPAEHRTELVARFQEDDEPTIFIGQIQAAGTGITLTRADTAIFYSTGWSVTDWQQARDRVHRIGQPNKVTYISLVARNTIDERIVRALADKRELSDLITQGWRHVLGDAR